MRGCTLGRVPTMPFVLPVPQYLLVVFSISVRFQYECSGGSRPEVKICAIDSCALHPYRFGKNPFRKKVVYSDEQRKIMADRLRKANARKRNTD